MPRHKNMKAAPKTRGRSSETALLARVRAAKAMLSATPPGDVDALVLLDRRTPQIVSLQGGETAYRLLVEAMNEGAATLSSDGTILYCNRRFSDLLGRPAAKVIGRSLQLLVDQADRERVPAFLKVARKKPAKAEFVLQSAAGQAIPVNLSLGPLRGYRGHALGMVITDLTEQRAKQEQEITQEAAVHRLLLERELLAQESERRRIARELHDEAGQLLTSLLVALRGLDTSTSLASCRSIGKRMRKVIARVLDEVGRLARGLHPIAIEDHGLEAALSRYVDEFAADHKVRVKLTLDGLDSRRLPSAVQIALYRVIQETLTNVARHARARSVQVAFSHTASALTLTVTDDGRGFDTSAVSRGSASHLGLRSIRERMALLGGTAAFNSGRKGTEVLLEIPLTNWELTTPIRRARN